FRRMPREPAAELWITFVGPLTNLVLAAPLLAAWALGLVPDAGWSRFVEWLGWTNLSLGLFNLLLPAFPMDGGRLVRALLARRMGLARATHVAAGIGRGVALLLGLGALLLGNLLLVLVAIFVFSGASAEEHATVLVEALAAYRAGDLAARIEPLEPDAAARDAIARMRAERRLALPVARDGRPVGFARVEAHVAAAPVVPADLPASQAAETISQERSPALVVDAQGRLAGVLTGEDLERAAAIEEILSPPTAP